MNGLDNHGIRASGPLMSGPTLLSLLGWIAIGVGYSAMLVYRKRLSRWQVAHSRFWRDRPHAQRIHELSHIIGALIFTGLSLFILYDVYVATPRRLHRMTELIKHPTELPTTRH